MHKRDDLSVREEDIPSTRQLGTLRFIIQCLTVFLAFAVTSAIPILILGQSSLGLALSAAASMAVALFIAWLWLRSDGAVAAAFNFSRPENWPSTIGRALLIAAAILLILIGGGKLMDALGLGAPSTISVISLIRESPWALLLWVSLVAWGSAAFGEEMLWRGFFMDRLSRLDALSGKTGLIVMVQAIVFALPHAYQGIGGVVVTGSVGLLLGWLRMHYRGNLWLLIIAHGLVDTTMMTAGYFDAFALIDQFFSS